MLEIYRGSIVDPDEDKTKDFVLRDDSLVVVEDGVIRFAHEVRNIENIGSGSLEKFGIKIKQSGEITTLDNSPLPQEDMVIMSHTVNCHDHSFQPPAIPGELIVPSEDDGFEGWLPITLKEGELKAKNNLEVAESMIRSKLQEFTENGIGATLQYATSSVDTVETVLRVAKEIGIQVKVGYVCMDQEIDSIQKGLQTSSEEAISATQFLLEKYGPEKIVVIDRFPLAVSSETRRQLANLAREHGALYETHVDETESEKHIHNKIYGTRSIIQTLLDDGVFDSKNGRISRVGLAHAIHTTPKDRCMIKEKIQDGCEVSIRACPQSNAALGSHWADNGTRYVHFSLEEWARVGANVTLGTDQGAGRNFNLFDEMLWERGRHPSCNQPTYTQLLGMGTINGIRSLGLELDLYKIEEGKPANFVVVKMAGANIHYAVGRHSRDIETSIARAIEGGMRSSNVKANYVHGKNLKRESFEY